MNGDPKFLLDTNIVLGFLNGFNTINRFFQQQIKAQPLFVSQITRMELLGFPDITPEEGTIWWLIFTLESA